MEYKLNAQTQNGCLMKFWHWVQYVNKNWDEAPLFIDENVKDDTFK